MSNQFFQKTDLVEVLNQILSQKLFVLWLYLYFLVLFNCILLLPKIAWVRKHSGPGTGSLLVVCFQ